MVISIVVAVAGPRGGLVAFPQCYIMRFQSIQTFLMKANYGQNVIVVNNNVCHKSVILNNDS